MVIFDYLHANVSQEIIVKNLLLPSKLMAKNFQQLKNFKQSTSYNCFCDSLASVMSGSLLFLNSDDANVVVTIYWGGVKTPPF